MIKSCKVLRGFTGFYRVFLCFTGFYLVLLGFKRVYWVILGLTQFYWVLLDFISSNGGNDSKIGRTLVRRFLFVFFQIIQKKRRIFPYFFCWFLRSDFYGQSFGKEKNFAVTGFRGAFFFFVFIFDRFPSHHHKPSS